MYKRYDKILSKIPHINIHQKLYINLAYLNDNIEDSTVSDIVTKYIKKTKYKFFEFSKVILYL